MRPAPLGCNGAVLIASLRPGEYDTAVPLERHFREIAVAHPDLEGMFIRRRHVGSKSDLFKELRGMRAGCERGLRPVLHLDMHGGPAGLGIAGGPEVVAWEELRDALTDVNRACGCQLCLTLAVCWGGYIIKLVEPTEPAPFWSIVGAAEPVPNVTAMEFFLEYYDSLFLKRSSAIALETARQESPRGAQLFAPISAREIFVRTVAGLVARARTASGRSDMVERARLKGQGDDRYDLRRTARMRENYTEEWLRDKFIGFRARFFMADTDPSVLDRCMVEWKDVLEEAASLEATAQDAQDA